MEFIPSDSGGRIVLLLIIALLPLVGRMLARTDPRKMMIFGLCLLATSTFYMRHFDLALGFGTVVFARLVQGGGMAFLWVPINTVAYSYLPREKNNAASGLINLARNVGASMGISYVTTMLDRRRSSTKTGWRRTSTPEIQTCNRCCRAPLPH